jgi:hypothetical protein
VSLTRLIYSSTREDRSQETLDGIMRASRRNNLRDEVTGVLVVSEGSFMQLLEGERLKVGRCLMRIMQDDRHRDIQIISTNTVPNRLFPEWSMHRVDASAIRRAILDRYLIRREFRPGDMKQGAIEDLCRVLSGEAALPSEILLNGDPAAETLGMLRKIHWAARQVIGESLGSRTLKPGTLEQLHASIMRQSEEVRRLQRKLEEARADDVLQEEAAKLISYFDETDRDLAQRLGHTQDRTAQA